MKKVLIVGLTALAMNAQAATLAHTGNVSNGPAPPATFPKTTSFSFAQFNPALGTLTGVSLTIAASASADIVGDNETPDPVDFTGELNGTSKGTIPSAPSVVATATLFAIQGPTTVTADEAGDGPGDFAGPDSAAFLGLSDSNSTSDSASAGDLAGFIGLGTLSGQVVDTQNWSVNGGGNAVSQVSNSQSSTDWTVTYTYTPVPEPSTALLGGIALLGLLRRRR